MSGFRFIHAADLHLGSPFEGLAVKDRTMADRFAEATRLAFSTLVQRALDEAVDFVVIAGDVYDGEWRDNTIGLFFNREVARLDRAGIPVFLLRGNHDAESVVTKSISLPGSVRAFETRRPSTFRLEPLKVALHGQGFQDRAASDNLVLGYPAPEPGWFNIGVLHTALTGRPPHAAYAPCTPDDLRARGYDYWALGHVHAFEIVADDPPMVFPGNLQGRNAREQGAKGAVLVTVADGRISAMERVVVDQARFAAVEIDISGCVDLAAVLIAAERQLAPVAEQAEGRLLALRVRLKGTTVMRPFLVAARGQVADEMQAACHRVHPDIWLEKLVLDLAEPARAIASDTAAGVDLAPLLDAVLAEPETRPQADALLAEIVARMPGGIGAAALPFGVSVEELLEEARDLVLARATGGEGR